MKERKLRGIVVAALTAFDSQEKFDPPAMEEYIDFLVEKGVDGLYICGSTGEGLIMNVEERKRVLETVLKRTQGKNVAVFAHCGSVRMEETVQLVEHAKEVKADGAGMVTPFYYKYSDEELFGYYDTIARKFSDFPIYLYNNPALAGNSISTALVNRLHHADPNIMGIKDSSGNFSMVLSFISETPSEFSVLAGYDRAFLSILLMGGDGCVTGPGAVFPELFVKVYELYKKSNVKLAKEYQEKLTKLSLALGDGANMPLLKVALKLRGIDLGPMRKPFKTFEEEGMKTLKEKLDVVLEEVGLKY
ncbi:MAG: dihydrodipicolinate synthase family protein [Thermotoga sp.]|nr:MAG: dihydrodipicolinate synthase family protein [Thermotoga sp.]